MQLVVDSNIVFSAIISLKGKTRALLFSDKLELFAPEFLFEEFEKHRREILAKSGLSAEDFELALSILSSRIQFVPAEEIAQFASKAEKACPDPNDREYFALAIKLNCPIWSQDKVLKKQTAVKVYSTQELMQRLEQ